MKSCFMTAIRISGTNVVWEGVSVLDFEIFLYNIDSNTTTQLTINNGYDNLGGISGSNVVWTYDHDRIARNGDEEIFFYDGNTPIQLTNNSYEDGGPQVSGSNVIWKAKAGGGSDYEIFYDDGATTTRLTSNDYDETTPSISDSNAVWTGSDGSDTEIFAYDGTAVSQVTYNSIDDGIPKISGLTIVWEAHDGNDKEIFLAVPRCYPFKKSIADHNRDCIVNFKDFAIFFLEWLECNLYNQADCGN
ncbi:MAG: TolB family protein [Planctomycetota bacterium]